VAAGGALDLMPIFIFASAAASFVDLTASKLSAHREGCGDRKHPNGGA
jgi:hypothetical protein